VRRLEKPAFAVLRKLSQRSEVRAYAPVRALRSSRCARIAHAVACSSLRVRDLRTHALLRVLLAQYIIAEAEIPDAESGGDMRKSMNQGFRFVLRGRARALHA
jgi:hypothetical protein